MINSVLEFESFLSKNGNPESQQTLDQDQNGGAVLHATVALANALRLPVTAEGIETEEQAMAVKLSGCDKLQGYLFSKPLPADEITARYFATPIAQAG